VNPFFLVSSAAVVSACVVSGAALVPAVVSGPALVPEAVPVPPQAARGSTAAVTRQSSQAVLCFFIFFSPFRLFLFVNFGGPAAAV
jgi:hypothetical protein